MAIGDAGAAMVVVRRIVEEERKPRNGSVITPHPDMAAEDVVGPLSLLDIAIHTAVQVSGYDLIYSSKNVLQ